MYYGPEHKRSTFHNGLHDPELFEIKDASEKRINALWGLLELRTPGEYDKANLEELELYGLGHQRSLVDYWKFAGIDMVEKKVTVFDTDFVADNGFERIPWNDRSMDPLVNHDNDVVV